MRHLAPILAALALSGCGSMAAAELPAPAGPPASPTLKQEPAGEVGYLLGLGERRASGWRIDRKRDRLIAADGRSAPTGREPIAFRFLDRGRKIAVLTGRERTLELYDARTLERIGRTGAGIGPTGLATDGVEILYVTDVKGDALLVFHLRPHFELIRRVHVIGGPYAIAFDRERWGLWMALVRSNQLVNYAAGSRPVWRQTLPMIRGAREVSVDGDEVLVLSKREYQSVRARQR